MSSKYLITAIAVFVTIFMILPYSAYAQNTVTTTSPTTPNANPTPDPTAYAACRDYPQQSQGQIPPFCARLIVIKNVEGGTASPSEFTFSISGNNPSLSTFQGSSSGTTIVLAPGSYRITEVGGPSGYTQKASRHCDVGTILAGQTITCRISNFFVPPPDTQPPQVLSFTVSPMRVSLSSGGTITITAHVTDATGVQRVGVFVQDECGGSPGFFQSLDLSFVSGTAQDGIYQGTFTFPESALNVNRLCTSEAAFQVGGIAVDTLGNLVGLPLIHFIILTP